MGAIEPGQMGMAGAAVMDDLGPFYTIMKEKGASLEHDLAQGAFDPFNILLQRDIVSVMQLQLKNTPDFVLDFRTQDSSHFTPPELWYLHVHQTCMALLDPAVRDPRKFQRKMDEYLAHGLWMMENIREAVQQRTRYEVITIRESQEAKEVIKAIANALMASAKIHHYDPDFLEVSIEQAMERLLRYERFDLKVALRIALKVPGDISVMALPKPEQRSALLAAISFAISCIPVVGNAVAAYEFLAERDIFGYPISDVERGIMAFGIMLPAVSRYANEGRSLYSAGRLASLHGGEVRLWSETLAVGERISADPTAFFRLQIAQKTIASGKRLTPDAAGDLADVLRTIGVAKADMGVPVVLSKNSTEAFEALVEHNRRFAELDANAIDRMARKRTGHQVQGMLLEELQYNRVVVWLRDPSGMAALNLVRPIGRVEYIPGHLIVDMNGRELTDGMIVHWLSENQCRILAVFETKSGARAAKKLSFEAKSLKKLNAKERVLLEVRADKRLQILKERARLTGTPVVETRESLMRIILKEEDKPGGQILRDIRRLNQKDSDGTTTIFVGGQPIKVHFSNEDTKFFGVVPSDVILKKTVKWDAAKQAKRRGPIRVGRLTAQIARELREAGVKKFSILGMGYTESELSSGTQVVKNVLGLK
jgi:hypothetical protein